MILTQLQVDEIRKLVRAGYCVCWRNCKAGGDELLKIKTIRLDHDGETGEVLIFENRTYAAVENGVDASDIFIPMFQKDGK